MGVGYAQDTALRPVCAILRGRWAWQAYVNFISLAYWLFFGVSALVYFGLRGRLQLGWIVLCSVGFYAAYKPAFLLILATQLAIDYTAGLQMARERHRHFWLWASVCSNVALLFSFKYLGWALGLAGINFTLSAEVPLGLSFHTFQGIAYAADVYARRVLPERRFLPFAQYIFFFPQLVAGPIERPGHFLPQVTDKRFAVADVVAGGRLILWGLVQKMVFADRLALVADPVFAGRVPYGGAATAAGILAFTVQILADFAGYTDIARGCARVLGYRLTLNFADPYGARSVSDFWRRWHISLSSWFRDYVYIPLGGNRLSGLGWAAAITLVFALSGLWHGASLTFLVWGLYHAAWLLAERWLRPPRWLTAAYTFWAVALGWVFFRAATLGRALDMLATLGHWGAESLAQLPAQLAGSGNLALSAGLGVGYLLAMRFAGKLRLWLEASAPLRWLCYYLAIGLLLFLAPANNPAFIYFQF